MFIKKLKKAAAVFAVTVTAFTFNACGSGDYNDSYYEDDYYDSDDYYDEEDYYDYDDEDYGISDDSLSEVTADDSFSDDGSNEEDDIASDNTDEATEEVTDEATEEVTEEVTTTDDASYENEILYVEDLDKLENTQHFLKSAIEHIFNGTINKKGNATGYHYDGILDSEGCIVEGTKSKADANGIYTGKVEINGIGKTGNKGYSTFYPENFTPQEVIDAINTAYDNKELETGNTYIGDSGQGFEIEMYLDDNMKIISAFPIKE